MAPQIAASPGTFLANGRVSRQFADDLAAYVGT